MSKLIPGTNDIFTKKPELVLEWDYDKNAPLTPNNVAAFSNKKYWWKCGSGHSWLATPNNRSNGYGCPYCSGRLAISGETDIASQYPALIHEWDYDKNDPVQPNEVTCKSNKKYWWKCDKGHSWQEAPQYRTRGDGCPYCSGHKVWQGYNDLATLNPRLAKEWNYEKNDGLTPKDVTVLSI